MINENAASANDTGLPKASRLKPSDLQHDAVILAAMLDGALCLDNEGKGNAMTATLEVAHRLAVKLSNDLDEVAA